MNHQGTLFDKRFLGKHAGQIMSDPTTALVELVANSWDAYATAVSIDWPSEKSGKSFRILDDGEGMSPEQFSVRWRTIDYNRLDAQGSSAKPPAELEGALPREVYGQNGRGRHAAFLFSSPYRVRTWRDGLEVTFRVSQGIENPIEIEEISRREVGSGHGTEILAESLVPTSLSPEEVRSLLSTRFLLDPGFVVKVDGIPVTFGDIPKVALREIPVSIEGVGTATVIAIDSQRSDRTTKQHGIAWWVNRRLVGHANWRAFEGKFIDGRTEEAKRYSFVVHADFLKPAVREDWSGFHREYEIFEKAQDAVHEKIRILLADILKERRKETRERIEFAHKRQVERLPRLSQDRWNAMLDTLIERCPTIGEKQLEQIMDILTSMEMAESQYSLLDKLHEFSPDDVDGWNALLEEWTLKTAKAALDEIARRLKLINEIRVKSGDSQSDEVQELQPLFKDALWIFGPEFESIEFTSNKGMTTVIKSLFKADGVGSLNRPDFVVLPESTIGFYSRPRFDEESNEVGVEAVVIVELKRPGVPIGNDGKNQAWKYIKELLERGHIDELTRVRGFVLGDQIERGENSERKEGDNIRIRPMLYSTFLGQAEKRMLNLHRKLAEAPFMKDGGQKILPLGTDAVA